MDRATLRERCRASDVSRGDPGSVMASSRLRICIGHGRVRAPGFLSMDERSDADIPYAGGAFPFEDRAVQAIIVAGLPLPMRDAGLLQLLLECRRVLEVHGAVRLVLARSGDRRDEATQSLVTRLAVAAGLDGSTAAASPASDARVVLEFTKRNRQVTGNPLVTIAIPAYRPTFFGIALQSALEQTYRETEIVVGDDSEGEAIEAIVRACSAPSRVRYVRNPVRLGGRGNYRQGLVLAQGEFVKFLNDDDALAPDCVERLVEAFRSAPDITLATSHRQRIDATGAPLPDQAATMHIVDADTLIDGVSLGNVMLMTPLNVVGEPTTVLFRKADLADLAPDYFRFQGEEGRGVIDMTLWATLLLRGDAVYLRDSLSRFRIHADQQQSDAGMLRRSAAATRGLQAAWRLLGLHKHGDPFTLRTKPYPFDAQADWIPQRVRSFQAISMSSLTERSA